MRGRLLIDGLLTPYLGGSEPRLLFHPPPLALGAIVKLALIQRTAPTAVVTVPKTFVEVNAQALVRLVVAGLMALRAERLQLAPCAPIGYLYAEI